MYITLTYDTCTKRAELIRDSITDLSVAQHDQHWAVNELLDHMAVIESEYNRHLYNMAFYDRREVTLSLRYAEFLRRFDMKIKEIYTNLLRGIQITTMVMQDLTYLRTNLQAI